MRRSAAVFCQDTTSLQTLKAVLSDLGIEQVVCRSRQAAMEAVVGGECSAVIADFDLQGAADVARMALLVTTPQKPVVLAMTAAWPGSGEAFQSGANRILYKPLAASQLKDAFAPPPSPQKHAGKKKEDARKHPRYEMKALVYLDFESGSVPALGINLSESGFGVQATEPVPTTTNLEFRCLLPGTNHRLHGHCDVIWADQQGRAGMFFSKLAPAARKHLKQWLSRHRDAKGEVRALLSPESTSPHSTLREH